jgi:predicted MFS family arabinose efflux permease
VTLPTGLRALNHAEFRRFFLTQLVSQTGGWIQAVALSWLVLQLTGSPLRLGLISTLQFAPVLLFSLVAGAAADRLPKRRVLIASQMTFLCQAVALALLVATGAAQYWQVCALALVVGFASVIDQPVRQSYIVELVGREDLGNAIALNSASFNTARIVGPALAGILIARFGVAPAFAVNALGFAISIAVLLRLSAHGLPAPTSERSMLEEMVEGVRYAAGTPVIAVALGVVAVISLCVFNFSVYVPLLARNVLHLGAEGFGFLMACLGVGAVAGALTVGASRPPSVDQILAVAAGALGGLVGLSAVRQFWTAAPVLFLTGFCGIMVMAGCNARIQGEARGELRGRVMGMYVLLTGGVFPIGAFVVGAVSERWGVSTAFLANGVAGLAALAALAIASRRRSRRGRRDQ